MEALLPLPAPCSPPSPSSTSPSPPPLKFALKPPSPFLHLRFSPLPPASLRSLPVPPRCSSCHGPSRNGPRSSSHRWDHDDSKYLEAHVVEAVSLLPSQGQLFMTLANGSEVELDHVNPPKGRLLYRSRNPTIFLKIHCEADLLLPIIVGDVAVGMLMKALHGEENSVRPNQYHLMKNLVGTLNFEVRMIRVTERVADTYHARIYLGRPGEEEMQSVDARPSDAVNLAVRCKVPIYVNKDIVSSDAVRPVYAVAQTKSDANESAYNGNLSALDCAENGLDPIAEEITLVKNMLLAAVDERYSDAAHWRDELSSLRAQRRRIRQL